MSNRTDQKDSSSSKPTFFFFEKLCLHRGARSSDYLLDCISLLTINFVLQVVSTVLINLIPPEAQRLSILSKAKITGKVKISYFVFCTWFSVK